jgi:hypothetical protein
VAFGHIAGVLPILLTLPAGQDGEAITVGSGDEHILAFAYLQGLHGHATPRTRGIAQSHLRDKNSDRFVHQCVEVGSFLESTTRTAAGPRQQTCLAGVMARVRREPTLARCPKMPLHSPRTLPKMVLECRSRADRPRQCQR